MKAFLAWLAEQGIFGVLFELGLGLFVLISFVRCSLQ